jgi:YggT family protein
VNALVCQLAQAVALIVNLYSLLLFVYAVISWFPGVRGRWVCYLASAVEPVLAPVRRIIPPLGGLDLAFLVVILVLQFLVRPALAQLIFNSCYPIF